jgi:hypothetical protein
MITFRSFYDKDYKLLRVYPIDSPLIPRYSLKSKVVFWHDFTENDFLSAQKKARKIGKNYQIQP